MNWVEELGSGKRNIKKFAPLYFSSYKVDIKSGQQFEFSITYQDLAPQVTPQVKTILNAIKNGFYSREEIMAALGPKDRKHFTQTYLAPAISAGLVARTDEKNPKNPHQRYFLTEPGRRVIEQDASV